mgnify:CR=1 FL=1
MWRIERPAWHDFAFDKLHDAGENFPAVYRYFDNFQAAAYYIEGSKMGILYDGLMPTNTNISLIDRVKEVATKPLSSCWATTTAITPVPCLMLMSRGCTRQS